MLSDPVNWVLLAVVAVLGFGSFMGDKPDMEIAEFVKGFIQKARDQVAPKRVAQPKEWQAEFLPIVEARNALRLVGVPASEQRRLLGAQLDAAMFGPADPAAATPQATGATL